MAAMSLVQYLFQEVRHHDILRLKRHRVDFAAGMGQDPLFSLLTDSSKQSRL